MSKTKTLKELRSARGLSQKDLAMLTGVHPTLISLLESGKKKPGTEGLIRIAEALGLSIPELKAIIPLDLRGQRHKARQEAKHT